MSRLSRLRAVIVALWCACGAVLAGGATTASAATDTVPASTMATLLGPTFPATDIRQGLLSPDHSHILYFGPQSVSNGGQLHPSLGDFYVLRADGTQRARLTSTTSPLDQTVKLTSGLWSPDSRAVSFIHNAQNQIAIDAAVIRTATLLTVAGQDAWTVTSRGEGVFAASYTPDGRFLVWEEHISDVFTIDVFAADLITGGWYRLRWKAESPAGSPWVWAGECDLAAIAAAPVPPSAPRLPASSTDPLLTPVAALSGGPKRACFPDVVTIPDVVPTPTPAPDATPMPTPGSPTPTPIPGAAATPSPVATPTPAPAVKTPVFPVPPSAGTTTPRPTGATGATAGGAAGASVSVSVIGGPELTIGAVGKRLRAARRRSLNARFASTDATAVKAWLVLATPDGPTLASTSTTPTADGTGIVRFVLDAKARRALRGLSRAAVIVRLAATDDAGNRTVQQRRIVLR